VIRCVVDNGTRRRDVEVELGIDRVEENEPGNQLGALDRKGVGYLTAQRVPSQHERRHEWPRRTMPRRTMPPTGREMAPDSTTASTNEGEMNSKNNLAALAAAARQRHVDVMERARQALRQFEASGEPVTYAGIARSAQVSRAWLYTQPEVRDAVDRLRDLNGRSTGAPVPTAQRSSQASLVRRLEAAHRRNQDLGSQVSTLREQLAAAHGELRALRRQPSTPAAVDLANWRS
jgi:hypothetical protein